MIEHTWVLENMASYEAGGLEAAERERLQEHIEACDTCALALEEARAVDGKLEALFADVHADPALEDRMIRALRAKPVRSVWHTPISMRLASRVAAVLLLGVLGAGMSKLVVNGSLPFPGMVTARYAAEAVASHNNLKPLGLAALNSSSQYRGFVSTPQAESPDANQLAEERRASVLGDLKQTESGVVLAHTRNRAVADARRAGELRDLEKNESAYPESRSLVTKGAPVDAVSAGGGGGAPITDPANATVVDAFSYKARTTANESASANKTMSIYNGATVMREETFGDQSKSERAGHKIAVGKVTAGEGEDAARKLYTYRNDLPSAAPAPPPAAGWFRPDQLALYAPAGEVSEKDADKTTLGVTPQKAGDSKAAEKASDGKSNDGGKEQPNAGSGQGKAGGEKKAEPSPAPVTPRKIIRSGEIEFEIESFDSAVATVTKLVTAIKGGFVATVNSEKLPNGKVRGSVVVRVPPEGLDTLVLDLRRELGKGGELKGQRIGSQDITKQYTDLESRLRAARAMEERLLQVIKTGKGEIKDLVQAEKELGVWRTKIEEIEGELRYYANLVSLSTLTITLSEREIQAPFAVVETERIQMGVEVEDVDKALREALAAVADAKGRVTKSEMKQHAAGQFSALLHFEVTPEAAGPMRDRLKQLGNVARLEIDRLQKTEGGTGNPQDAKSKRSDSQFIVALYNLTNVAPRETVQLKLVCEDVEAVYKAVLTRIEKVAARVVTSNLNRQRSEQTTGTINFEVRSAEAEAVLLGLKEAGEVMRLQITENPDVQNTTKSKRGFNVELWALGQVAPRETSVLHLATRDVPAGYRALQNAVTKAKGRVLNAQLNEQDNQNITAQLDFEIRRADEAALDAALSKIGDVYSRNLVRAQDNENVIDSKVRWQLTLINAANLKPRENFTLAFEVADVDKTMAAVKALALKNQGRTLPSQLTRKRDGSVVAKLVFDVPLAASAAVFEELKTTGKLRLHEYSQNTQVPEVALAVARFEVTLSNTELIVPSDDGLWPQVRKGLSNSFLAIFWSLSWVIFGVLVVLPWALLIYGGYRLVVWLRKKTGSATV